MPATRARPAFTIVELLVVVAIIALLVAFIIPTLAGSREQAKSTVCTSRLKGIGTALRSFLNDSDNRLPQVWLSGSPPNSPAEIVPPEANQTTMIGALFAGTTGDLPAYGIDEIGAARRPLNPHLGVTNAPPEPRDPGLPKQHGDAKFQVEAVLDPADRGLEVDADTLALLGDEADEALERRYELLGSSYVLNEFALSLDPINAPTPEVSTLIPQEFNADGSQVNGGRMPRVDDPGKTILAGDGPIHNFHRRMDRRQHWHFWGESVKASRAPAAGGASTAYVEANLLFVDLHVGSRIKMRPPAVGDPDALQKLNTTPEYTFLPSSDWLPTAPGP